MNFYGEQSFNLPVKQEVFLGSVWVENVQLGLYTTHTPTSVVVQDMLCHMSVDWMVLMSQVLRLRH